MAAQQPPNSSFEQPATTTTEHVPGTEFLQGTDGSYTGQATQANTVYVPTFTPRSEATLKLTSNSLVPQPSAESNDPLRWSPARKGEYLPAGSNR